MPPFCSVRRHAREEVAGGYVVECCFIVAAEIVAL
jgi:hypothetical protein